MPIDSEERLCDNTLLSLRNYNGSSVRVSNISRDVCTTEVLALFEALVGPIQDFQEFKDAAGTQLEVAFFNRDEARALCMAGYNMGGTPLSITPVSNTPSITSDAQGQVDDRRNLYVLGLPFALTKNEFAAIFARYGTVSHCVILATVDNSSRRRGFIVMSTHEEAKRAMSELTRTQIKGHTIDVSWAVVQRSRGEEVDKIVDTFLNTIAGFLDGSDRAMLLDPRDPQIPRNDKNDCSVFDSQTGWRNAMDAYLGTYIQTLEPSPILLVTRLPALLFSQTRDLEPLFCPFGEIKKLQVIDITIAGTLSVLVQYLSSSAAQEAKQVLQGQRYINCQLDVQFLALAGSFLDQGEDSTLISPLEQCNFFDSRQHGTSSAAGFRPQLKSYNNPERLSGAPIPVQRPNLSAITNLSPIDRGRKSSGLSLSSPRWNAGVVRQPQLSSDQSNQNNPLNFNHCHNLLA